MATTTFTLILGSPISTPPIVTAVPGLVPPVAAGTKVADIVVGPAGWVGAISLGNVDAASFAVGGVSPAYTLVAATQLTARTYVVDVNSAP